MKLRLQGQEQKWYRMRSFCEQDVKLDGHDGLHGCAAIASGIGQPI
jgi:hypothetical protein